MAFSRYNLGEVEYFHKDKLVNSTVGSKKQDNRIKNLDLLYNYDVAVVPVGYEHRPDLISNVFFGTPAYWFLILEINNITDPFESLNVGDEILIPKLS